MKKLMTIAAIVAAGTATMVSTGAQAEMASHGETMKVMQVENGANRKPPFKRRWVEVPVTDIAAADAVEVTDTVEVRTVRMGANRKAPFKREVVVVPVVDTAMAEPAVEQPGTDFRGRPPFKRHR